MSDRQAPPLGVREMARWFWRQLTSMRVALILLFLLAVAAIPGSLVPQRGVEPLEVSDFRSRNPGLSEWYDRLGLGFPSVPSVSASLNAANRLHRLGADYATSPKRNSLMAV